MANRVFHRRPALAPLYARSAVALLPGAGRLPGIPGAGGERMPADTLLLESVRADPRRLAAYERVCGFARGPWLPPTYPHVLAFPLHMRLMSSGSFPFAAAGLVHIANEIVQQRPLGRDEPLELSVRSGPLHAHPKGHTFTIRTLARAADGVLVWVGQSTMLARGAAGASARAPVAEEPPLLASPQATWPLLANLGRRYATVSGDRNPIHLHRLSARAFGFPRPIAHGMWTKARVLAHLQPQLPDAFAVDARFRHPIALPGIVSFAAAGTRFAVRDAAEPRAVHLEGSISR